MSNTQVDRKTVKYEPKFDRFVLNTKNYSQQYNGVYIARLSQMRTLLRTVAKKKWGNECPILSKIIDIESEHEKHEHEHREYILIGTLYKDMALRGSVLDEFKEKNGISGAVQSLYHIATKDDSLVLEDESGRIALGGAKMLAHVGRLVTGVVVAVRGSVDDNGVLNVVDWTFAHTLQTIPSAPSLSTTISAAALQQHSVPTPSVHSKYLLLVSGLHVGNPLPSVGEGQVTASELSVQLLFDFVAGRLTNHPQHVDIASRIVRVIVAGDSVAPVDEAALREKQASYKAQKLAVSPSKQLDILLAQLLSTCHADILPGELDPSNLTLPQQPLHPCLFPHSCRFSSFHRVTNPYEAAFDGVGVLGHSGQPVTDIARQRLDCMPSAKVGANAAAVVQEVTAEAEHLMDVASKEDIAAVESVGGAHSLLERLQRGCCGEQSLDVLQDTLSWGHLCPTSPDTLSCYPFQDTDPFIIAENRLPQLMFCGNQKEYGTRLVTVDDLSGGTSPTATFVRLISVPTFALTGTAVLVDISTPELVTTVLHFR